MSVHVMSWVLRHSEEKLGNRLVLLVLADHASDDGSGAWPSVETIGSEARLSERQVQRCLRSLEASEAISDTGRTAKGTTIWGVNMSPLGGDIHDAGGVTSTTSSEDRMSPEPSLVKQPSIGQPSEHIGSGLTRIAAGGLHGPRTVDRKAVTDDEREFAWRILNEWNRAAGQTLRSNDWLAKIIMRCREYPEATLADHTLIIETALANPWWSGPATPSVVYGNGAQFERSVQAVRATRGETEDERFARIVQAGVAAGRRTA